MQGATGAGGAGSEAEAPHVRKENTMRLRNIPGSREIIAESEYIVHNETEARSKWKEIF